MARKARRLIDELTDEQQWKAGSPIFDELWAGELGQQVKAIFAQPKWDLPWVDWNWEHPRYRITLPSLSMGEAVKLVADRLTALTTPTSAYPVVDLQAVISDGRPAEQDVA